jgi:hypothetical protein
MPNTREWSRYYLYHSHPQPRDPTTLSLRQNYPRSMTERKLSVQLIFLVHICSSLDQTHSCGCVTRDTCKVERSKPEFTFLIHTRSSLDQSRSCGCVTKVTCIRERSLSVLIFLIHVRSSLGQTMAAWVSPILHSSNKDILDLQSDPREED